MIAKKRWINVLVLLPLLGLAAFPSTSLAAERGPLIMLQLDPEGADFAVWLNHLKDEVYEHWPTTGGRTAGARGEVVLELTVAREGTVTRLKAKDSTGELGLRKAAETALRASRLDPLPAEYRKKTLVLRIRFALSDSPAKETQPGPGESHPE